MTRSSGRKTSGNKSYKKSLPGCVKALLITFVLLCLPSAATFWFLFYTETGKKFGKDHIPYYTAAFRMYFTHPTMPQGTNGYGIDVSHYLGRIDWDKVAQIPYHKDTRIQEKDATTASVSIGFAFVKATEGADITDDYAKRNIEGAREAGIPVGAYHVMTMADAGKQAENFFANSYLEKGDLAPVIDLEDPYFKGVKKDDVRKQIKSLASLFEKKYGTKPIIYCSHNYSNVIDVEKHFPNYPLWIARYVTTTKPEMADIWQFADNGRIPGIRIPVDLSAFYCKSYRLSDLTIKK